MSDAPVSDVHVSPSAAMVSHLIRPTTIVADTDCTADMSVIEITRAGVSKFDDMALITAAPPATKEPSQDAVAVTDDAADSCCTNCPDAVIVADAEMLAVG